MSHPSHSDQVNRLNRIAGQVTGVVKMIEDQRYCADILTQIKAIKSAIRSVESNIVETHLNHCVTRAIEGKDKFFQLRLIQGNVVAETTLGQLYDIRSAIDDTRKSIEKLNVADSILLQNVISKSLVQSVIYDGSKNKAGLDELINNISSKIIVITEIMMGIKLLSNLFFKVK